MKVTYNWLKDYVDLKLDVQETSQWLTDCGLEIDAVEEYESVRGGLKGLVIGQVLTCENHPDSDHLHLTTVNIGAEVLPIVCGASNVAVGQKVVVATVGTVLYKGEESFAIKKSKIRGAESLGMICAEDEIGLGSSHDGIMVLPEDIPIGIQASDYFKITQDTIFEIGLTPNRCDATSHLGVARDLAAMQQVRRNENTLLKYPSVAAFKPIETPSPIKITIEDSQLCPRYTGLCLKKVQVAASPAWLQEKLKSVGIRPINNVVDVTNFVLMETGQPMHAFDCTQIKASHIVVRTAKAGEKLVTLDGVERKLSTNNLMICNESEPMCIAGVFGGEKSGISEKTTDVFLESAYFNAVSVRKTAREHGLNTDASFRYERGADPNITVYAIERAALLLQEVASAEVAGEIIDYYPQTIQAAEIKLNITRMQALIGKEISKEETARILTALEMQVQEVDADHLLVRVPTNKADVVREADLTEEVLRIYGYNRIEIGNHLSYTPNSGTTPGYEKILSKVSDYLSNSGFYEIMNNSFSRWAHLDHLGLEEMKKQVVTVVNPLSQELNMMRPTLLFGGLESLVFNLNHKQNDLKMYEFGRTYQKQKEENPEAPLDKRFSETSHLGLWMCGAAKQENWLTQPPKPVDFYTLKETAEKVLRSLRLWSSKIKIEEGENTLLSYGLQYVIHEKNLLTLGEVKPSILAYFGIKIPIFYADFEWDTVLKNSLSKPVVYVPVNKFPEVKRDLALLVDQNLKFSQIENTARSAEKSLLKEIRLFDVYQGDKLAQGKKSYAVSFILQDAEKTLTDKQIEKSMEKIFSALQSQLGAQLR